MIIEFDKRYTSPSDFNFIPHKNYSFVTVQDKFPARLICKDLRGSSFPYIFLVNENGREKIILTNSGGITGSRDRKYDICIKVGED